MIGKYMQIFINNTKKIILPLTISAILIFGSLSFAIADGNEKGSDDDKGKQEHGTESCEKASEKSKAREKNPHCKETGTEPPNDEPALVEGVDVAITLDGPTNVSVGEQVSYTVTVFNQGTLASSDFAVRLQSTGVFSFTSGCTSPSPTELRCPVNSLASGESRSISPVLITFLTPSSGAFVGSNINLDEDVNLDNNTEFLSITVS